MRHDSAGLSERGDPTDRLEAHHRLAAEFDAWADAGRGDSMERGHWATARQALDRIPFGALRAFLDLGCGNGYAVRYAAERMPAGSVALGLDVSSGMLAQARTATEAWNARRGAGGAQVRYLHAPFDAVPLPASSVDAVFTNEAIYYAPDVDAALSEVHRILRPGGGFWCSLDFYTENPYSHDWPTRVGLPMTLDSERGWAARLTSVGFSDVQTERLLDTTPTPPLAADADEAARARHEALVAWKSRIGTLLVTGTRR